MKSKKRNFWHTLPGMILTGIGGAAVAYVWLVVMLVLPELFR